MLVLASFPSTGVLGMHLAETVGVEASSMHSWTHWIIKCGSFYDLFSNTLIVGMLEIIWDVSSCI